MTSNGLYVAGGFDSSRNSVADVSVFDGSAWVAAPSLPMALNHPAAAAIGDDVYVAGGFNNGTASSRAFVLTVGASSWTELPALNVARGAAALVNVDGALYLMGGNVGTTQIADVERFDPATQTWSVITQLPNPRNHLAGYVDDGHACAAGGREPETSGAIDCLDPATLTWSSDVLPTPTSGAAAAVLRGSLLVAGGEPSGETSITARRAAARRRGMDHAADARATTRHRRRGVPRALLDVRRWDRAWLRRDRRVHVDGLRRVSSTATAGRTGRCGILPAPPTSRRRPPSSAPSRDRAPRTSRTTRRRPAPSRRSRRSAPTVATSPPGVATVRTSSRVLEVGEHLDPDVDRQHDRRRSSQ